MFKVGDKVTGNPSSSCVLGLFQNRICEVLEIADDSFKLSNVPEEYKEVFWGFTEQFMLAQTKCPKCGADPCACDDDVELDASPLPCGDGLEGNYKQLETKQYKHKALSTQALTPWPSTHMRAAILLNELEPAP